MFGHAQCVYYTHMMLHSVKCRNRTVIILKYNLLAIVYTLALSICLVAVSINKLHNPSRQMFFCTTVTVMQSQVSHLLEF